MRNLFCCLSILLFSFTASISQISDLRMHQLDSLMLRGDKHILIYIRADWCKVCHMMEETTWKDKSLMSLIRDSFYFISLDASQRESIEIFGHTFKYIPNGPGNGLNELAHSLGSVNGNLILPAMVILNGSGEIEFQFNQYVDSKKLLKILDNLN